MVITGRNSFIVEMRFICILILLFQFKFLSFGQEYSFVKYSVENGLPQTQVYALSADNEGYLWFGTAGGAAKFNGKTFEHFSTANGLTDNIVVEVKQYAFFTWVFTNKGVTRIKGREVFTYDLTNVLNGQYISSVCFRHSTNSLIVSNKEQEVFEIMLSDLYIPQLDFVESILLPEASNTVRRIYEDSKGQVWIVGNNVLGYLDGKNKWFEKKIEGSLLNVADIREDRNGNYWISVYDEGVYLWNENIIDHYGTDKGLASSLVRKIFIDSDNRVWCASKNGVSVIRKDGIINFNSKNGLPNDNIETICEDNEANIWLGSDGSGAFRFTSDEFVNYNKTSGLKTDYVMCGLIDHHHNLWWGTYNAGIVKYNGVDYEYFNVENGNILNNVVWSALEDSQGRIWFGTSNGLTRFEEGKIVNFSDENWLPSNKITSIYENLYTNEIWLGTSKGLGVYRDDSAYSITENQNFNLKNIRAITNVMNHHVWLGTSNGIIISDGSYFEPWIYNDQLNDKVVYCLENYKDSLIFIGTGNGLYYSNGIQLTRMNLHKSFGANYINFLGIESDQYLWVGTNYGVFEVNLKAYLKDSTQGVFHHTENSGLRSVETNLNSIFIDHQNGVWMGTGNGMLRFDRSKRNTKMLDLIPKIVITEMSLDLKSTDWTRYTSQVDPQTLLPEHLSLSARQNYLTFYFEGVSLSHPDEVMYKIKLDGLDEEWTPAIHQNSFTYPNLSYGEYVFSVMASIDGIHWSEPESISFEIRKPFYLTWWFILMVFAIVLFIGYYIYYRRKLMHEQKLRTEKLVYKSRLLSLEQQTLNASMNRHFIFNALNSIQYYINTQDRLSANKYLTSFAKLIRKNLDSSVNDSGLVTLRDELERLELYISLEHMRFQQKFEYEITVGDDIDQEMIKIPSMILQPFVENSIWHGLLPKEDGGRIKVNIFKFEKGIKFLIEDNGIGIDVSQANKTENSHHSKGMLITSGRIELLKKVTEQRMSILGPYQLFGEDGHPKGTRVELILETN